MHVDRNKVSRIKEEHPPGTRLRLLSMAGEDDFPAGLEGEVVHVDDIGQIHMNWSNGRTLPINTDVDEFERIEPDQGMQIT